MSEPISILPYLPKQSSDRRKFWITSDQHYQHDNIIKYFGRPFPDVKTMDVALRDIHNAVVGPETPEDPVVYQWKHW
ncbi:MAG: hypothetical protein WCO60_19135 [Verrucomicrobiota bacterium]